MQLDYYNMYLCTIIILGVYMNNLIFKNIIFYFLILCIGCVIQKCNYTGIIIVFL